jgi:hypothetical protein
LNIYIDQTLELFLEFDNINSQLNENKIFFEFKQFFVNWALKDNNLIFFKYFYKKMDRFSKSMQTGDVAYGRYKQWN